jgi:hypothetical protein
MTPNAWFLNDQQRNVLAAVKVKRVMAEFEILQFQLDLR